MPGAGSARSRGRPGGHNTPQTQTPAVQIAAIAPKQSLLMAPRVPLAPLARMVYPAPAPPRVISTGPALFSAARPQMQVLLAFDVISYRILGSGWIQGVCADILSHTWPVRGGDQPRTTPMPFQRISTDFRGSPDRPRRAETAERATWGTKTPPRPPTAGTPPAPARVRRKPRRWDPLVPIWG
jgi:hypothetical protein